MYDLPELRAATDAWWSGIARHCRAAGIDDVPAALERERPREAQWADAALLLSQTCGHPLARSYGGVLRPALTPCYDVDGCDGPLYHSVVLVNADDDAARFDDLAGSVFAVNGFDSWSGWQVLLLELAVRDIDAQAFVAATRVSGTHRASIAAVRTGTARACAVDCVTFALLARVAPAEVGGLRVVHRTVPAPALPYVTHAGHGADVRERLQCALRAALDDPDLEQARTALLLRGGEVLDVSRYLPMANGSGARALLRSPA